MTPRLAPWRVSSVVPLHAGESLDGYVARVAAAHHMPRLADVTEVAGAAATARPHATFCEAGKLDVLADCLRLDPETVRLHSPLWSEDTETLNFFGTSVPKDFLQFTHRRFSPEALGRSPHHRALWYLRILPICIETWTYLQDCCPNPVCSRRQAWRRTNGIDLCDFCAEPLTRAEAIPVPDELRPNLQNLIDLVHPDPARRATVRKLLPTKLTQLSGGELLELACTLAPILDPRAADPISMRVLSLAVAADIMVPALAQTWPLLSSWPLGFQQILINRLNQNARSMAAAKRDMVYRLLYKPLKRKLSQPVLDVIHDFAADCRAARRDGVTIAEAIQLTGGRQPALFAMRRNGELPTILGLDGCRFQPLIPREAIEDLIERNKPRERLTRAAERLGVPTYTVHQLVHDGLLQAAPPPPGCTDRLAIYQASLAELSARLHDQLGNDDEGYDVNIAQLMKRLGGRPKPWSRVFSAILAGHLSARLSPGKLPLAKRIMVKSDAVLSLPIFADRTDMAWDEIHVIKADLADMMNITPHNFSHYSDFLIGPGEHLRDIPMMEAMRLARTYVGSAELAHRQGLHFSAVRHFLESRGVKAAYRGLYMRAEAERLFPGLTKASIEDASTVASAIADPGARHGRQPGLRTLVNPVGRLRLPAYLRHRMGLNHGGQVEFEETANGILMRPVRRVNLTIAAKSNDSVERTSPRADG